MKKAYCIFDLETTTMHSFKRFSNPFDARNKKIVVALLLQNEDPELQYAKTGLASSNLPWDKFNYLVGHNLKFDLLYIWKEPEFQDWLQRGGRVYDTMTGEYLLTAQEAMYASLDELTEKYGGEIKDNKVTEQFQAGRGADEIDPDLLLPYAENDVVNTEMILLGQSKDLKKQGSMSVFTAYMEHYLALCEMESNGLYFDTATAQRMRYDYENELKELKETLEAFTSGEDSVWDIPTPFNFDSTEHLSAFLFGGTVPVIESVVLLDENGEEMIYGPKAQKAGQVKTRKEKVLYTTKGHRIPLSFTAPTKKALVYSTDESVLSALPKGHYTDFVETLLRYREVNKFLATYLYGRKYKPSGDYEETGLIPLVMPADNCIHHTLDCVQTKTGRLNSKNPNGQNIPKDLLKLFTSRFGDKGKMVSIDYCLAPETRVLTEDFKWIPIEQIQEGDKLVGFDEFPKKGRRRSWKQATVEKTKRLIKDCVKITTEEGELICSKDHMWLVKNKASTSGKLAWTKAEDLHTEGHITKVCEVWDTPNNFETGYASGFLESKLLKQYPGTNTGSKRARKIKILKIEDIGKREVIAVQTDTKTFLAEGFMSHNCQLEVRVQAYLAQCPQMIQDIKDGVDFHCLRLAYAVDKPYEDVVNWCNEGGEWAEKRRQAKTISFQKAYGASPASLAKSTGLAEATVEKIFKKEDERYPEIEVFYETVQQEIKRTRVPKDRLIFLKDKRTTGDTVTREGEYQGIGYYQSITGKRYHFWERAVITKRGQVFRYFSRPDIYNFVVQGTAADIVSLQVGKLFRFLADKRDKCLLVNEVHDEVVLDIKEEYIEELVPQIKEVLEDVDGSFKEYFGLKFNVPIEVDVNIGDSWGDCK